MRSVLAQTKPLCPSQLPELRKAKKLTSLTQNKLLAADVLTFYSMITAQRKVNLLLYDFTERQNDFKKRNRVISLVTQLWHAPQRGVCLWQRSDLVNAVSISKHYILSVPSLLVERSKEHMISRPWRGAGCP